AIAGLRRGCFSSLHVNQQAFKISTCQRIHSFASKQRNNVMLDSALIATERRFLLVSDTLREIELAKLGNGDCCLVARSSLGRVTTIGDLPEESLRFTSGRFRRPWRAVLELSRRS